MRDSLKLGTVAGARKPSRWAVTLMDELTLGSLVDGCYQFYSSRFNPGKVIPCRGRDVELTCRLAHILKKWETRSHNRIGKQVSFEILYCSIVRSFEPKKKEIVRQVAFKFFFVHPWMRVLRLKIVALFISWEILLWFVKCLSTVALNYVRCACFLRLLAVLKLHHFLIGVYLGLDKHFK